MKRWLGLVVLGSLPTIACNGTISSPDIAPAAGGDTTTPGNGGDPGDISSGDTTGNGDDLGNGDSPDGDTSTAQSCSDRIQNQSESGVDCGGPCTACPALTPNWHYRGPPSFGGSWINAPYNMTASADSAGNPVVAFASGAASLRMDVVHWDGTSWANLGAPDGYNVSGIALALDHNDVPYLAHPGGFEAVVSKLDGTWSDVGSPIASVKQVMSVSLAITSTGAPIVALYSIYGSGDTVVQWNGTSWGQLGTLPTGVNANALVLDANDHPIIAGSQTPSVATWNGSAWTRIDMSGVTSGPPADQIAIAVDSTGAIIIAFADSADSAKPVVWRWSASTWTQLGGAPVSASMSELASLAIDATDHVYLAYDDGALSGRPTVMMWNGSTWSNVGSPGLSSDWLSILTPGQSLLLTANGTPELLAGDFFSGRASMLAFDGDNTAHRLARCRAARRTVRCRHHHRSSDDLRHQRRTRALRCLRRAGHQERSRRALGRHGVGAARDDVREGHAAAARDERANAGLSRLQ